MDHFGIIGLILGFFVAPPQLYKIMKHKTVEGISLTTYSFLCASLFAFLVHSVVIEDPIFIIANGANLVLNSAILCFLIKWRKK